MHETETDLAVLQSLIDSSFASAGEHLLGIFTPERRMDAAAVCAALVGMNVLSLATVTASGEPRVAPVDGLFYRGAWFFGSSPTSARASHIRRRPAVSAVHTRGEELAVIVHGVAVSLDMTAPENAGFKDYLISVYAPRYGDDWWESFASDAAYWRIDARRMFTFRS